MSRIDELKAFAQELGASIAKHFAGPEEELPDGVYRFAEGAEVAMECARPGTFVAMDGQKVPFTVEDLKGIASSFKLSEDDPVHLKIGHDPIRTDTPDYGRVTRLEFDEGKQRLIAYGKPEPELVRKNRAEGFRRCSMELVKKAGSWAMEHLSLLGAKKPAISGLVSIALSDGSKLYFASPEGVEAEVEEPPAPSVRPEEKKGLDTGLMLPREKGTEQETQKMSEANAAELETAKARLARFEKDAESTAKSREKTFLEENVKKIPMTTRRIVEGRLAAVFAADSLAATEQRFSFSTPDGKGVVKETFSEILTSILLSLPEQTTKEEEIDTTKDKGAEGKPSNLRPIALGRNPKVQFAKSDRDGKVLSQLEEMRKTDPKATYTQALEVVSEAEAEAAK